MSASVPNKALHRKNPPPLRYGGFSGELGRYAAKHVAD